MKVLFRNFIKLLSIGAFGSDDAIEPMSEYKWNRLFVLADRCKVKDFINAGISRSGKNSDAFVPQGIYETAQAHTTKDGETDKTVDDKPNYNGHEQVKKFANFYLNKKYNQIVFNEVHSIDTSVDSLVLLDKLIANIDVLMNSGLSLRLLFDLGFYLRNNGDKVDFVKMESWIRTLGLNKMGSLVGHYLVFFFRFSDAELPFLKHSSKKNEKTALNVLEKTLYCSAHQVKPESVGVQQSINPITKPNTHPLKYLPYYPLEASSRFIANIAKSLSNIDE